ncbi:hypothetical protein A2164_01035 [Candidatus Curtissbacteria bacterium RBG_13_35_7]|uniref:Uncharacterized protein n=1 Tax=Candidatus Curtissbacteria bacterium RBG_13_35_7 TaxID=1797705 RepID=A0A1F5G459_9BACT|nr:MAG: hypothetical protein A2164_01035 [Candidatus Curtissbacteria bacterium RBG_13_35_7]
MLPKLKKGVIHTAIIALLVVGFITTLTILSFASENHWGERFFNRGNFYREQANNYQEKCDDQNRSQNSRERYCQLAQEYAQRADEAAGGSASLIPSPSPQPNADTPTVSPVPLSNNQDNTSPMITPNTSQPQQASCQITSPAPTQVTGLEGAGVNQVLRLKPGGVFTVNVNGVTPSVRPVRPPGAYSEYIFPDPIIPYYYIKAYTFRTLMPQSQYDGSIKWYTGSFKADNNGSFTERAAIPNYNWFAKIAPAPAGTSDDDVNKTEYLIPLYRMYLIGPYDKEVTDCGMLLVDLTAPGDTIP